MTQHEDSKTREATYSLLQKALDFAKGLTSEERNVIRRWALRLGITIISGSTAVAIAKWLIG